jgi:hypothetical protein
LHQTKLRRLPVVAIDTTMLGGYALQLNVSMPSIDVRILPG